MKKYSLLIFIAFFLFITNLNAQTFEKDYNSIHITSLGVSETMYGLNFNIPLNFSKSIPTLNKKYPQSRYKQVFYVLKSKEKARKIFSMYSNGDLHTFYTDSISSVDSKKLNYSVIKEGAIINYNYVNTKFSSKKDGILFIENSALGLNNELYELLVCSTCISEEIKFAIQTYLALKFGITLENKDQYYNSKHLQIWDNKYDLSFNNHIFGIVRDDYFNLHKTMSYSNTDKLLTVLLSTKSVNKKIKNNETYILVGNDNKEKQFDSKTGEFKRSWLVQNKGNSTESIDFEFNVKPTVDSEYFLTYLGKNIHNDSKDSIKISFRNIDIPGGSVGYAQLQEKKKLSIEINKAKNTLNTQYFLGVNEVGEAPFYVVATDIHTKQTYSFVGEKSDFLIENLPKSTYSFVLNDVEGKQAKLENIAIDLTEANIVSLSENWDLQDNQTVVIKPSFSIPTIAKKLEYKWFYKDKLVAHTPTLLAYKIGDYRLELTDSAGKKQMFPFTVGKLDSKIENLNEQWYVTPNPVKAGEEFTVHYDLTSNKKVDFYIYTVDGKFVLKDELGIIKSGSFNYRLNGASTYLLIPIINSKASMQKLIVK
ncbi:MAG: hypothetical protein LBI72_02160 [Flavobacteriaceae bacterium]|jgi:hypothetical protein|nr:hypothetical protein [Flavobacteriaceae bacterium]